MATLTHGTKEGAADALRRRGAVALLALAVLAATGCAGTRSQAQSGRVATPASPAATPVRSAPLRAARQRLRDELRAVDGTAGWSIESVTDGVLIVLPARTSFASDRAELLAPAAAALAQTAAVLGRQARLRLRVTGHTDSVGRAAFNEEFSRQRALAVTAALTAGGIAAERIEAEAVGERAPRVPEVDAAGREANRRVEILVYEAAR
jgi:outer membrane protein OmpA-like peptidoglycan-associated protein